MSDSDSIISKTETPVEPAKVPCRIIGKALRDGRGDTLAESPSDASECINESTNAVGIRKTHLDNPPGLLPQDSLPSVSTKMVVVCEDQVCFMPTAYRSQEQSPLDRQNPFSKRGR